MIRNAGKDIGSPDPLSLTGVQRIRDLWKNYDNLLKKKNNDKKLLMKKNEELLKYLCDVTSF